MFNFQRTIHAKGMDQRQSGCWALFRYRKVIILSATIDEPTINDEKTTYISSASPKVAGTNTRLTNLPGIQDKKISWINLFVIFISDSDEQIYTFRGTTVAATSENRKNRLNRSIPICQLTSFGRCMQTILRITLDTTRGYCVILS